MRCPVLVAIIITFAMLAIVHAAEKASDPNYFWQNFRQAVINQDHARLSALTHFPFEVRGPDDGDPIRRFDKKSFKTIFRHVLVQPVFVQLNGKSVTKSMLEIVGGKVKLDAADFHNPDFFQIEQFEFQRINGHWAFTRAYLEE